MKYLEWCQFCWGEWTQDPILFALLQVDTQTQVPFSLYEWYHGFYSPILWVSEAVYISKKKKKKDLTYNLQSSGIQVLDRYIVYGILGST